MPGVRQEEDHGGDGGEERVGSGQKKAKDAGQVRTRETIVEIGMKARRTSKSRSLGCVPDSRSLGSTFSRRLGGIAGSDPQRPPLYDFNSVHRKRASMTKPSSCTYVLPSSCLCCKYMNVPMVCSFNSHPVKKTCIIKVMKSWNLLPKPGPKHPSWIKNH